MSLNDQVELVKKGLDLKVELARVEDREALVEAKSVLLDIKEQMLTLREENSSLKEKMADREDYVLESGVYWKVGDTDRAQPFCPTCWSNNRKVPMQPTQSGRRGTKQTTFVCSDFKNCNTHANPYDYRSSGPTSVSW
jgi:hypothetical protein